MSTNSSDRKLNIAMLGHKRIPSREGGIEIVVSELTTRMVKLGHNVTCYNRGGKHVSGSEYGVYTEKEYEGVRLKKVWTVDKKGLAAVSSSIFATICAAFGNYDVVHFHAEGPCLLCGLPKLFGKKVVVTIHGLDHMRAKWGRFASWYIMRGEKSAVKHADSIIVLSKGVQNYFMDTYGRETVLIPNGVSEVEPKGTELISDRWNLKKDDYILFLGRMVPEKGVHYLLEAYSRIQTDKKLVIAGGASDSSEYYASLREKASAEVIFTDFVQGQALEELYSNAYIYCLPSDLEGMPLSLLEAMSYGNACLVSDIPECADVVEDKAAIFAHGDIDDLTKVLQNLCDNPEKVADYKKNSSKFITEKFNWNRVTEDTLRLYV